MEKLFVAYYRVSTQRQEASGLGLEAQKESVLRYIKTNGNKIIGEFTETESGKNDKRPELEKALKLCLEKNATLVIAKLDRLSRNLTFISTLQDNRVKFLCVDMPEANELTVGLMAVLAQWERKRISERTKEALSAKRQREPEWRPGKNNFTEEGRQKAHKIIRDDANEDPKNIHAWHYVELLRKKGFSLVAIADRLNKEGYKTRRGGKWFASSVSNLVKRFE